MMTLSGTNFYKILPTMMATRTQVINPSPPPKTILQGLLAAAKDIAAI